MKNKEGSQPTYEELKLSNLRAKNPGRMRSQPTYEELKPYDRPADKGDGGVFPAYL